MRIHIFRAIASDEAVILVAHHFDENTKAPYDIKGVLGRSDDNINQ